jgi:hypothetical protein
MLPFSLKRESSLLKRSSRSSRSKENAGRYLSRDTSLFMASSNSDYDSGSSMHNAGPEWQAGSMGGVAES